MRTFDMTIKPGEEDLPNLCERGVDTVREIAHDLMNQLTVIDLCVFQLRAVSPAADSLREDHARLARAVEQALHTGKRLTLEIHASEVNPSERKIASSRVPAPRPYAGRRED